MDLQQCTARNIHKREVKDIEKYIKNWISTPQHYLKVDPRPLLQSNAITEVEMEDVLSDEVCLTMRHNNCFSIKIYLFIKF